MPFFLDDALKFIMNSSHINFKFKILHVIEFMSKTKSNHLLSSVTSTITLEYLIFKFYIGVLNTTNRAPRKKFQSKQRLDATYRHLAQK